MDDPDHVLDRLSVQLGELLELQRQVYARQAEAIKRIEQIQDDLKAKHAEEVRK